MARDKSQRDWLNGVSCQGNCRLITSALVIKQIPNMMQLSSSVIRGASFNLSGQYPGKKWIDNGGTEVS